MHVHVALYIGLRHQGGQCLICRSLDFALVFPQLGRNKIELELGIDLFFGFAGNWLLIVETCEAVFAQGETHLQSALTQGNVVSLGAGEVLQGGAEGVRWKQTHIHLHTTALAKADLVFALRNNLHQAWESDEVLDQLLPTGIVNARRACHQDIEITDRLASAAQ